MAKSSWIGITKQDRTLLLNALGELRRADANAARRIDRLTAKLLHGASHPKITVGVHGGEVQWMLGNPFPIRICDYDASSEEELPDVDERGQRCRIWWEPANDRSTRITIGND